MPNDKNTTGTHTRVMKSFEDMGTKNRTRLRRIGIPMVVVAGAAGLWIGMQSPPLMWWVMDFVLLFVGLFLIWPVGTMALMEKIPKAASALPLSRLQGLLGVDRRSKPRDEDE